MININELTIKDIGKWVKYIRKPEEKGKIKSWNNRFIFVVYKCAGEWGRFREYTGAATNPKHLEFIQKGSEVNDNQES